MGRVRAQSVFALLILTTVVLFLPGCRRQPTGESVEGTVMDTAGKPVAGVRVFNSGDGPKLIETRTDPLGRFRLLGIASGPLYVFAEKAGYRFTGTRATAEAKNVAIQLMSQAEPPAQWPAGSKPMPLGQQRKLARGMLEKLWAEDSRSKRCSGVAGAMSRIDPELALRWAAELGPDNRDLVRASVAQEIADKDLDEAFGLIGQSGVWGLNILSRLARRYAVSDHAKAMRCAEELALRGRAVDQPWRAAYLAEAGRVVIQAGNKNAGWKLLDEAGGMAAKFGSGLAYVFPRGIVARAMAPTDLKRALALLEPASLGAVADRFLGNVAMAICLERLDAALQIAAKLKSPYAADHTRLRIAYRLAPTRPTDAIRVAEALPAGPYFASWTSPRAMALGWVAAAIAPHDKPLACSVLDRAIASLTVSDGLKLPNGAPGGWPACAGFLAVQAEQIGYPDMESIVYRALACRPMKNKGYGSNIALPVLWSETFMAGLLSLVDRQVATDLLESIDVQARMVGLSPHAVARPAWLKAWCLVDAKRGQALFDEAFAAVKNKPGADNDFYQLVEAASLLAAPPEEKPQHILNTPEFRCPYEDE